MVQVVMMMNWNVWNGQSVKRDLVNEMSLEVYSRRWEKRIEQSGL